MTARRLSQCLALSLAALTWWVLVSRPGAVEPEFAMEIRAAFIAVTAVVFGLSFLALRLGSGGSTVYWSADAGAKQIKRIGLMIGVLIGIQLIAGRFLDRFGVLDIFAAEAVYLLAFTLVPAAFLQFGLVKWPTRLRSASKPKLFVAGVVGVGVAGALSYAAFSGATVEPLNSTAGEWAVRMAAVVVGATAEEVIFRVLLLTALLGFTGSRFQAVFLSSVAFGLMHVPGALAQPIAYADWAMLQVVAFAYAPEFLMQTLLGLFLGVLWLRTGSIVLVALTHTIVNVGATLVYGL